MFWFRKRYDFFKMLLSQAQKTQEGLRALCDFFESPSAEKGMVVQDLEKQADDLRRSLIESLNQTFVTPIDREDIFALSRTIDDMIDYAKSTVEEMMLFNIHIDGYLKKMAEALYTASRDIVSAVKLLPTRSRSVTDHIIRAKKTENFVEHIYREALVELFKNPNVIEILKTRELYRHLSNAA
ncbi:MAG: DUF47 family protein, partial [Elusimicrobia bacterium]|nr:DUF47 family protein [Elusimicrobiota bacterium]